MKVIFDKKVPISELQKLGYKSYSSYAIGKREVCLVFKADNNCQIIIELMASYKVMMYYRKRMKIRAKEGVHLVWGVYESGFTYRIEQEHCIILSRNLICEEDILYLIKASFENNKRVQRLLSLISVGIKSRLGDNIYVFKKNN